MKNQISADVQRLKLEMEYRNYSPSTVSSYCETMRVLERALKKSVSEISAEELKVYLQKLIIQQECSVSYVNQHISAFKIFHQDILKKDWEGIKIKRPRGIKTLPVVLSVEEVERMISSLVNLKHRTIIVLMYSAGLRRSELINLKPKDIDSERMRVHIRQGKGKKDRYTLLSPACLELLRSYYKVYRPKTYLFEPQGVKNTKISDRTIEHIVKKAAKKANITKNVSPHTLRHSFATHLLEQGVNIKLIQQFLGHTSLRTTSIYLHLTNTDLTKVQSPLDSMNF